MATRNVDGTVVLRTTGKLASTPTVGFKVGNNRVSQFGVGVSGGTGMNGRMLTAKEIVVAATSAWRR